MLTPEIMAGLALAVFWIHVVLIAAAAGLDLRDLIGLRRRLGPVQGTARSGAQGLFRAEVRGGQGPGGALARNVVEQVGRSKGDGQVHFSDAAHRSELYGGELELADGTRVSLAPGAAAVWPALERREQEAAPRSPEQIAESIPQARRGKGFRREVEVRLETGSCVWIGGRLGEDEAGWAFEASEGIGGQLLVCEGDPRSWLRRRSWSVTAFILAELALAAACTVAALWPPLFGWVSLVGAGASLGFFLAVQPLGVSLNESVRTPDRAYLRGTWR